jgi:hypothetical protein
MKSWQIGGQIRIRFIGYNLGEPTKAREKRPNPPQEHLPETPSHDSLQKVWDSGKLGYKFRTPDLKRTK